MTVKVMLTDKIPENGAIISTEKEIADLLDTLVDDVIHKERQTNRSYKSTATLFRCDDPSSIAVAYSYEEMNWIVEEFRKRPENVFNRKYFGLASTSKLAFFTSLFL